MENEAENVELQLINQRLGCRADLKLKLLVVGSSLVGKTSLVSRFDNPKSNIDHLKRTLPGSFHHFIMPVGDGRNAQIRIWDMCGMEKLHEYNAEFYAGVNAVMLVFALDNYDSFNQLPDWLDRIGRLSKCSQCQKLQKQTIADQEPQQHQQQQELSKKPKKISPCQHIDLALVGNKSDLGNNRLISSMEADEFALHYGMTYVETSALSMDNVQKAFYDLVLSAVRRQQQVADQDGLEAGGHKHQRLAGWKALCCSCTTGRSGA
ncbi:hypothetical protein BOX15_Mlig022421g1 [Macrostomum lignano]|uniref:Uncharacterized protein n=2 Tax=Macrostomum lignano TaxID=282301 RepID=A0A267GXB1_9PLAT|nr:hypothetical protein BOX15_Mlig022421g1 [Macrostomum lignano]